MNGFSCIPRAERALLRHAFPTRNLHFFDRLMDGYSSIARAEGVFKRSFQLLVLYNNACCAKLEFGICNGLQKSRALEFASPGT